MNKIPEKLRKEIKADPFYKQCCLEGGGKITENKFDQERIEWHHNLIFAGSQLQEKWCILPIKKRLHDRMFGEVKEKCDWIMLNRANDETLKKYSKAVDLLLKKNKLNVKFGIWKK